MFFVKTRENLTQGFEIILKLDQNNAFLVLFQRNIWKFSQKLPKQLGFSSNARKFYAWFFHFFLKNRLNSSNFCNFLEKFFGNFLSSGGLRPTDPLRGRPPKIFPRTEILAAPLLPLFLPSFWTLELANLLAGERLTARGEVELILMGKHVKHLFCRIFLSILYLFLNFHSFVTVLTFVLQEWRT